MLRQIATMAIATTLTGLCLAEARAAEPIVGRWRLSNGETTRIGPCGPAYCIDVETGKYKGKRIGRLAGSGNDYAGEVTDPTTDKTYEGTATIGGASLKLTGCAFKVFCKSQTWTRD